MLKQLGQLLFPLRHILSELSTPSPIYPPPPSHSCLTLRPEHGKKNWATHSGQHGVECKRRRQERDETGTDVSGKDNSRKQADATSWEKQNIRRHSPEAECVSE